MIKKVFVFVVCLCIMLGGIHLVGATQTSWESETNSQLLCDINNDGITNTTDARILLIRFVSNASITAHDVAMSDYNRDKESTTSDVRYCLEDIIGKEGSLRSLPFDSFYINLADSLNIVYDIEVISDNETWKTFQNRFTYKGGSFCTVEDMNVDFAMQSIIAVPYYSTDIYIPLITTDEENVYVSTVTMCDPNLYFMESTNYVLLVLNTVDIKDKSVCTISYMDSEGDSIFYPTTRSATTYDLQRDIANAGCACDHQEAHVIESVDECEAYIRLHSNVMEAEMFKEYDNVFFEDYVLIVTHHRYPTTITCTSEWAFMNDAVMLLSFKYKYVSAEVPSEYANQLVCVAIPRDYYNSQAVYTQCQTRGKA